MDALKDIFESFKKIFEGYAKSFEGFEDAIREVFFWLIGIPSEASKNKTKPKEGMNIKGYLFIWPFIIAFIIVLFLLVSVFFAG